MMGQQAGQGWTLPATAPGCLGSLWFLTPLAVHLQRVPRYSDLRHGRLGVKNENKLVPVASRNVTLNSRLPGGPRVLHGFSSSIPGDALQGPSQEEQLDKLLDVLFCMDHDGTVPSINLYRSLLQECTNRKALTKAKLVHAHLSKHGLESNRFLGESVVCTLIKCGDLEHAIQVFFRLPQRSALSWKAVISGYSKAGKGHEALRMYDYMREDGFEPDTYIIVSLLKACCSLADLEEGKRIHAEAVKYRCSSDVFVGTCLVDMYAKLGNIEDAQAVFDSLSQRDVVSWAAMLSAYVQHCQGHRAMQCYEQMQVEGIIPDSWIFVTALQACGILPEEEEDDRGRRSAAVYYLQMGKVLHAEAWNCGHKENVFVGNTLVSMYGKCGSIADAKCVFAGLPERNKVAWNALLLAYVQQGQGQEVIQLYEQMSQDGVSPDDRTFFTLLQACGVLADAEEDADFGHSTKVESLGRAKVIQAEAHRRGSPFGIFLGSTLVSVYRKCGSIMDAHAVFERLSQLDVLSWNVMLSAYSQQGQAEKALQLYMQMLEKGLSPDAHTFVSMLQACGKLAEKEEDVVVDEHSIKIKSLYMGKRIHHEAWRMTYKSDVCIGNTLVSMYSKCGSIADAQNLFEGLPQRDRVSWNAMVAAYAQQGQGEKALQLYEKMLEEDVSLDDRTFVSALQACAMLAEKEDTGDGRSMKVRSLERGKLLEAEVWKRGYKSDLFIGSTLVSMYGRCGSILDARKAFDGLSVRDLVAWNAMLVAHAQQGQGEEALQLYRGMQEEGVSSDVLTFLSALQACGICADEEEVERIGGQSVKLKSLVMGKEIHAQAKRKGYGSDNFLGNVLVAMYGKCGSIMDAEHVFGGLSQRDVVTWTAMLSACVQVGEGEKALELYGQIIEEGISQDAQAFGTVLQACSILAEDEEGVVMDGLSTKVLSLHVGKIIHGEAWMNGHNSDVFVNVTLIVLYGKCGSVVDAQNVFDTLSEREVISWNALMAAYAQQGQGDKALQLYREMQEAGESPDEITVLCILEACSNTGNVDFCRQVHQNLIRRSGNNFSLLLANTLIHTYGRCACMVEAQNLFNMLAQPDVVSWNALIAGYARQGSWETILQRYEDMKVAGVKPNEVTFVSLLSACSHAGTVNKGVELFQSMSRDHGLTAESDHYVSMVDLLGRAGNFTAVQDLVASMPMLPTLPMWLCLLGACRKHGKVLLGKRAFDSAVSLQPKHSAPYMLMSSIYAHAGMWEHANEVTELRRKAGARKSPGQTWIGHSQELHKFVAGDCRHQQQELLYDLLGKVSSEPKGEAEYTLETIWEKSSLPCTSQGLPSAHG